MFDSTACRTVALFVMLAPAVQAQSVSTGSSTAQTKPARPDCSAPEHRQFDFWIGDWDVTSGGKPAGHNRVDAVEDGCAINEHWTGTTGSTGVSYNAYDRVDRRWHQFWVSNGGMVLHLARMRHQ